MFRKIRKETLRRKMATRFADFIFLWDGSLITDPDRLEQIYDNMDMMLSDLIEDGETVTYAMSWAGDIRDAAKETQAGTYKEFINEQQGELKQLLIEVFGWGWSRNKKMGLV